jgi:adenylate cyclase
MGDGFIALFDVKDTERDVLGAISAGLEMLDVIDRKIHPYANKFFGREIKIGIGLHYGLVVAGTIGSRDNKRQTIIGDAVNFASRIESINKTLGTHFLVSEDVHSLVHNHLNIHRTHTISIRGKSGMHTVYEVTGLR